MQLSDIVLYWFLFVSVSSMIGSLVGTLLALSVRGIIKKWMDK